MQFEPISQHRSKLGESPVWSDREGALLYVDVHSGTICRWRPGAEPDLRKVADRVTFILETAGGGLALGLFHGIGRLASFDAPLSAELTPSVAVEADRPTTSVNDARVDPRGRLWFGTLERQDRAPVCGLYSWTRDHGLRRHLDGVSVANGLQWSPDGRTLYFIDSWKQRIDAFDYDPDTGSIGAMRVLAEIPKADGMPDGLTVDAEGRVWVALYGGGAIRCYTPAGRLDRHVAMPVQFPSSLAFGGADGRMLFVTTSSVGFHGSGGTAGAGPDGSDLAGRVLATETDVTGVPTPLMAERFAQIADPAPTH